MIKVNKFLSNVERTKYKYSSLDQLRLHASERDLNFNKELWDCFIKSILQEDVRLYPNVDKAYDLVSMITNFNKESLTLAEGSDRILKNIFECFSIPETTVVSTNPCFPMYKVYANLTGSNFLGVNYSNNQFPFEEFLKSITDKTSMVIISNPSSPVGDSLTKSQIVDIAERCKIHNCVLVVDEAYIEFSDIDSASSLIDLYNVIVVRTFSKSQGSAGFRLGYSVSNSLIKSYLSKVSSMNEVNGLSIKWIEALLQHDDSPRYIELVKNNRAVFLSVLDSLGIKYIDSKTNYVNVFGKLQLQGITVKHYQMPSDNQIYTRISIPADIDNFKRLIEEVKKV